MQAYPDTVMGTDSHTTMINGLGVVGWGVGGIEAEACMLGQPISMLLPSVVGFKLKGKLPEGATATDLVLTVTQMLRAKGVVGRFVEFFGAGVSALSLADRATIANMAPEYGATIGFFPIDDQTLDYLRITNRPAELIALVEAYAKEQGLFLTSKTPDPAYSDTLELDLANVTPSLAGPKRPQDRIDLKDVKKNFLTGLGEEPRKMAVNMNGTAAEVQDGSVVIAAITSCTNTSNPSVMLAAGLARQESCGTRPYSTAAREDESRSWLESRHGLLQGCRPDSVHGETRVSPRRLRMHDLYWKQRSSARRSGRRGPGQQTSRSLRAQRKSQLRRTHQFAGSGELPRVTSACGRLCAGRTCRYRSCEGTTRHGRQR